jgi:hypothetical protein
MATYKVLQDIEAEDTLVGPLTLRQLIYALTGATALYLCFLAYQRQAIWLWFIFLPIAIGCAFFGFPWKGEQPTEIWALARLRFMVKPRVRIWNQDGMKDLVTVTVPRRAPVRPREALSPYEVQSRLKALADTIDSRGWATRNANYQYYMNQQRMQHSISPASDRLINAAGLHPEAIPMDAFLPSNDMLDEQSNVAQNFDALLARTEQMKRERVQQQMAQAQMPQANLGAPAQAPAAPQQAQPQNNFQAPAPAIQGYIPSPSLPAPTMPAGQQPYMYVQPVAPQNLWFVGQPAPGAAPAPATAASGQPPEMPAAPAIPPAGYGVPVVPLTSVTPVQFAQPAMPGGAPQDEKALSEMLARNNPDKSDPVQINYAHMRVLQPPAGIGGADAPINYGSQPSPAEEPEQVTRLSDNAILGYANNDDLNVATIARQAKRDVGRDDAGAKPEAGAKGKPDGSSGEVEVRLH